MTPRPAHARPASRQAIGRVPMKQRDDARRRSIGCTATTTARIRRAIRSTGSARMPAPADREIAGFCAAALAFGRVASVLNSIDTLFRILGPHPAAFVRTFDPSAPHPELRAMVHRWTRGEDIAALLWVLRQMLEEAGSIEQFFAAGLDPDAEDIGEALDRFSSRALAFDVRPVYGRLAETSRSVLLLPAAVGRQRVQAAQSVLALDGAARRGRSRCLDLGVARAAHRAAGHPCDQAGPLPPADEVRQPGLADGRRHHPGAARAGSRRSGAVRFRVVSRRDDGRVRRRPPARQLPVPAEGAVPPTNDEERSMNRLLWFVLVLAIAMGAFFAGTKLATRETLFAASADGDACGVGREPSVLERSVSGIVDWRRPGQCREGRSARAEFALRRDRVDQGWQPRRVPDRRHPAPLLRPGVPCARPDKSRW